MDDNVTKPDEPVDLHALHFAAALNRHMEMQNMDSQALAQKLAQMYAEMGRTKAVATIRREIDYARAGKKGEKNEGVGRKVGEMIAKAFGCTYGQFLHDGEMLSRTGNPADADAYWKQLLARAKAIGVDPPILKTEPAPDYIPVPTARTALSAGSGNLFFEDELTSVKNYFHSGWLLGKCVGGIGYAVIFKVEGGSMSPTIEHGSEVLVDTTPIGQNDWQPNKIYAIRQENEVWIKRLLRSQQPDTIVISSDNKEIDEKTGGRRYEDRYVNAEDLHIIGRVIWHSGEL